MSLQDLDRKDNACRSRRPHRSILLPPNFRRRNAKLQQGEKIDHALPYKLRYVPQRSTTVVAVKGNPKNSARPIGVPRLYENRHALYG